MVSVAPITFTLITLNIFVFVAQLLSPEFGYFIGYSNAPFDPNNSLAQILMSSFAHSTSSFTHILFNMYSLFVLGTLLEPMLGKIRFLTLYAFSIFGGGLGFLILSTQYGSVVGASGAVFGLMGAYLVFLVVMKLNAGQMYIIIGLNLVLGFLPGIAWEAHVGGLVVGAAVGYVLVATRNRAKQTAQTVALVGIGIALFVVWFVANAPLGVVYY
jgi:membrane associated rhomboid family serine protease